MLIFSLPHDASHRYTIEFLGDKFAPVPCIMPYGSFKLLAENFYNLNGTLIKFSKEPTFDLQVALDDADPFVAVVSTTNRFAVTLMLADDSSNSCE